MREFAFATVKQVENHFKLERAKWLAQLPQVTDDVKVRFFLEELHGASGPDQYLYHGMCEAAGELSEPIIYGHPKEIPREWLDKDNIWFYFKVSVDKFCSPDFWDQFFNGTYDE